MLIYGRKGEARDSVWKTSKGNTRKGCMGTRKWENKGDIRKRPIRHRRGGKKTVYGYGKQTRVNQDGGVW